MIISPIVADFASLDHFDITGRGRVYTVPNPRDVHSSENWGWLLNHWVRLDGRIVEVIGVESYAIYGTYSKGRPIGLLVREIPQENTIP